MRTTLVTGVQTCALPISDTKKFALKNIKLEIPESSLVALSGPSGSGKTTLLNLIAGLDVPSAGSIKYEDVEVTTLSEAERSKFRLKNIGFIFQSYNLIPVLNVIENIAFTLQLQGESKEKRESEAVKLLNAVGLSGFEKRLPSQLSGGQQQRVAIARALATKPRCVLADEPTANLDSSTASSLLDLILDLNLKEKVTFILSSHDASVVDKMKRVIRLKDGEIVEDVTKS
jgi:putative ABC transport system ATP-binding protein